VAIGARLAAAAGWPFVMQPVTPVAGGPGPASARRVLAAQARALAIHRDVRVIPQTQQGLGLR